MKNIMKLLAVRHDFYADYPFLGAKDLHLLEKIAIHEHGGVPLTVTNAMAMSDIASPASIHRIMDRLEYYGLIERKHEDDFRTKWLTLAKPGVKYFKKLEKVMESVK